MIIKKEQLETLWYEDEKGNKILQTEESRKELAVPINARYQVSQSPNILRTTHLRLICQEDVDKCNHPIESINPEYDLNNGFVGRECSLCNGSQTKKKDALWDTEWTANGSREVISINSGWSEDLVMALVNSKDYTLREAIIIAANSCERCKNVLGHKYGLDWGYKEGSEEWEKCGTLCKFCES